MGLGLAIVKKIVLEHGGEVRYEARDAHPQFVITLPATDA
jgi:nitrogen-specific signal transduction histidine kinase